MGLGFGGLDGLGFRTFGLCVESFGPFSAFWGRSEIRLGFQECEGSRVVEEAHSAPRGLYRFKGLIMRTSVGSIKDVHCTYTVARKALYRCSIAEALEVGRAFFHPRPSRSCMLASFWVGSHQPPKPVGLTSNPEPHLKPSSPQPYQAPQNTLNRTLVGYRELCGHVVA